MIHVMNFSIHVLVKLGHSVTHLMIFFSFMPLCIVLNLCTHLNSVSSLYGVALGRGDGAHVYIQIFFLSAQCPGT